jgi:NitT/TauT family transport system ATP-binding protein
MTHGSEIILGFQPLVDSAVLIAAAEIGFAADEGLTLSLRRGGSWDAILDDIASGTLQGAHMPAPLPVAVNLGLLANAPPVIAPIAFGLGGNAVTVSIGLHAEISRHGLLADLDPAAAGAALRAVIAARRLRGAPLIKLSVAHRFSGHHYELRYWLSACGIDPDRDLDLVVLPSQQTVDALAEGRIDACCVGEPWSTVAIDRGLGRVVTVKSAIWRNSPEKVLGLSQVWADDNPLLVDALLRALHHAADWCAHPDNIEELAGILGARLALPGELMLPALSRAARQAGTSRFGTASNRKIPRRPGTFPWQSHALWFYSQMVRWGDCAHLPGKAQAARDSYRPDLYRRGLKPIFAPMPGANMKVEGALMSPQHVGAAHAAFVLGPDSFFDGRSFDPDRVEEYILYHCPA